MPTPRRILVALGLLLAGGGVRGQASVDTRPAIEIGSYRVSHYLVQKYYGRHALGTAAKLHRALAPAETQAWLDQYVARQALVADLLARGWFDDPAVRQAVATMEEHMLTQPEGPYYASLFAQSPPPADDVLRRRYSAASQPIDCVVAGFPDPATRDRLIGTDFLQASPDEQLRRIQSVQARPDVRYFAGTVRWPFDPFAEIGDRLIAARENAWDSVDDPDFGSYLILKRRAGLPRAGDFERDRAAFAGHASLVDRQILIRRHRTGQLRAAKFQLDPATAGQLLAVLAPLDAQAALAPADPLPGQSLYRFAPAGPTIAVPARDWAARFNQQFIRHLPRSAEEIGRAAEDDAMHQLDLQAARALGLDRTPQFTQDRTGYTALQALDAYERRELSPRLTLSAVDLQAYYEVHRADFVQTLRIKGRLVAFPSAAAALAWRETVPPINAPAPVGTETLTLARGQTPPGFASQERPIFDAPPGFVFGPVEQAGRFLCFQKIADLERAAPPLEQIRDSVHAAMLRAALDRRELQLGADLLRLHPPIVTIDAIELAGSVAGLHRLPVP